jgi:hypothetical protein
MSALTGSVIRSLNVVLASVRAKRKPISDELRRATRLLRLPPTTRSITRARPSAKGTVPVRNVPATPAGQRILPFVARITNLIAQAGDAARDDGAPSGSLILGGLEQRLRVACRRD